MRDAHGDVATELFVDVTFAPTLASFNVVEVPPIPNTKLILRSFESDVSVRVLIGTVTQIAAGLAPLTCLMANPPGTTTQARTGTRGDISVFGYVARKTLNPYIGWDMVCDPAAGQFFSFVGQTANIAQFVSAVFQVVPSNWSTLDRMIVL